MILIREQMSRRKRRRRRRKKSFVHPSEPPSGTLKVIPWYSSFSRISKGFIPHQKNIMD
jgi:hypothetical protein